MTFDLEDARTRVQGLERPAAADIRATLADLAQPRLTGSDGAAGIERELRDRFGALGYDARPLPFSFSTWPGRFGLPAAGAVLLVTGSLATWLLLAGSPIPAAVLLVLGLALAVAPALTLDRTIPGLPWGRVETANLLFQRPDARPSWILMAHRDSKSQIVPSLVRTAAIGLGAVAWLALLVLAGLWIAGPPLTFPTGVIIAGIALGAASLTMILSWSGNRSPGALDNGTGLAALLAVAASVRETGDIAFLVTDGEELGLAGARDVATRLPAVQGVINVEGMDDDGRFYIAEGTGWRRRGSAPQLVAALLTAAQALGLEADRRKLPHSLLVDHQPLVAAGIPSLTVLRGGWSSLLRVHRPGDDMDALSGEGAASGAALLTAAVHLLRDDPAAHLAARGRAGS